MKKPDFIRNWRELEPAQAPASSGGESMGFLADFAVATGLSRLKIAHLRLPPGTRSNPPGAYRDEEEFVFVLEGAPDLWLNGNLHATGEGDGIAFNDNTGIAHTLVNNSDRDVRLFVFGEATRLHSQFACPLPADAATNALLARMGKLWANPPRRKLGPNGAKPGDHTGRKQARPDFVVHWRDILEKKAGRYPKSTEDQTRAARFGRRARFSRIGIHLDLLKPGTRTSWPHAERDEEEFVYVVSGRPQAWTNGHITQLNEGDFVGWQAKTGITHVILNNSDADVVLLVGSEASRARTQFWYPFHPSQNKMVGPLYWADHPIPRLGPHDGMPDLLRARVPAAKRRNAVAANEAARNLGKRKA
ncbi:MAG: cupin domain-containing protein [Rhizomicrobium sp.]